MLNLGQIKQLAAFEANPCVSIYLPTHRKGPETGQDHIRLKNLLSEAQERLVGEGMRETEARDLLARARERVDDTTFWQHQYEGLAIFIAPSHHVELRLPDALPEEVHVGVRFYIRHLLPLIAHNGCFYLLTIAQDEVRLFGGSRHGMAELDTPQIPDSIEKERALTDYQEKVGFHPTGPTPTTTGTPTAKRHAGGEAPQDVRENELKQWLRGVANGVERQIGSDAVPLVVAADERNFGHFKAYCSYPQLQETGITEHPESLNEEELHRRAWRLLEPLFTKREQEAQDHFASLAGEGHERASRDVPSIVRAAKNGRIDVLFVAQDNHVFGSVDPTTGEGKLSRDDAEGEDLLDRMTVEAMLTGAQVYALPQKSVPGGGPAAAILRY